MAFRNTSGFTGRRLFPTDCVPLSRLRNHADPGTHQSSVEAHTPEFGAESSVRYLASHRFVPTNSFGIRGSRGDGWSHTISNVPNDRLARGDTRADHGWDFSIYLLLERIHVRA